MLLGRRRPVSLIALGLAIAVICILASCGDHVSDQTPLGSRSLVIPVYETGFYGISLGDLKDAGVLVHGLEASAPKLSHDDIMVPVLLAGDSIVFYGQGPTDRYSPYRPYLLEMDSEGITINESEATPADGQELSMLPFTLSFEENRLYDGRPIDGSPTEPAVRDPWFWETIQQDDQIVVQFEVPRELLSDGTLTLDLVGVSNDPAVNLDHDLAIVLNDHLIETVSWDGISAATLELGIPDNVLQSGTNKLVLDNTQSGAELLDVMRLDRFKVTYRGEPVAVDGRLETEGVEGMTTLAGFDTVPLLFDVAEADAPVLLSGKVKEDGEIMLEMEPGTHLVAVEPDSLLKPQALMVREEPYLGRTDNQADLIVIAPQAYVAAVKPLAEHRRNQGLSVELVAIEQIYQEFASAGFGPFAINAFLAHAYNNWLAPHPSYLLLVGDASYDYRNYLGQDQGLLLPAPMVSVTYSGETVSDARLADVDGDGRPDMAVGRWPVRSSRQVEGLVRRTIANESTEVSSGVIFAADGAESRFSKINQDVSRQAGFDPDQVTFLNGPTSQEFEEVWAAGAWLVTYTGHGSLDRWGQQGFVESSHVRSLETSTVSPIVLQLTCLTGLFAHPTITSLSEEMLLAEEGPVSVVAATSLSLSDDQRPFGVAFLQAVHSPEVTRVGDAFQYAKSILDIDSYVALREISDTFTLFGDPTALIRRPPGE